MRKSRIASLLIITSMFINSFFNVYPVKAVEITPNSAVMNQIVQNSYDFLGASYVYGAEGPSCFDCSGFVQYLFNSYGFNLSKALGQNFIIDADVCPKMVEMLGVDRETAAEDACKIEHDISPKTYALLKAHYLKISGKDQEQQNP